jgi:hypothetical protein
MQQFRIVFVLILLLLIGCSKKETSLITEKKFEDILFELYKAEGYASHDAVRYGNEQFKKEFLLTILNQKGVTIQQYDSTITWYNMHAEEYAKLYERLYKRVEKEERKVDKLIAELEEKKLSPKGDSVNIWKGSPLWLYQNGPGAPQTLLSLVADKHFHPSEKFVFRYHLPILPKQEVGRLLVELKVVLSNGSEQTVRDTLKQTGNKQLQLRTNSSISTIQIQLRPLLSSDKLRRRIWFDQCTLLRINQSKGKKTEASPTDSVGYENVWVK